MNIETLLHCLKLVFAICDFAVHSYVGFKSLKKISRSIEFKFLQIDELIGQK